MKKQIRWIAAIILMVTVTAAVAAVPASAGRFGVVEGLPNGYWDVRGLYDEAKNANNAAGITANGEKLINLWLDGKTAEQRAAEWTKNVVDHGYEINDIWTVSRKVAETYESSNDMTNAVRFFRIALAFVDPYKALITNEPNLAGNPNDMEFARREIQAKIAAYDVSVTLYAEIDMKYGTGDTSYKGAKFEPKTGILYGEPPAPNAIMDLARKPSSTVIFVLFETEIMSSRVENDLKANEGLGYNRKDYSAIEIAWNFVNEGATLKSVPDEKDKITAAARYLNTLGLPILLRIGAEMNVWEKPANPDEYKTAFRFIADIMRKEAPNVAIVWSVNDVSSIGLTYDMFYPGAEYVDWVGVSLYARKYFNGIPNTTDSDAAIWGTGKFTNPLRLLGNLIEEYGSRHPIAISEGGVTLRNASNNEDLTKWALPKMRQIYSYIPMVFPQVKAIYWNNRNESKYDYNFSSNQPVKELYGQLTSSEYFIGKGESEPKITYKKLGTATLPSDAVALLAYAPYFTFDSISVQYTLDGRSVGQSETVPYRNVLDLSGESDGAHKLGIRVMSGGSLLKAAEYNVYKSRETVIISTGAIAPPNASPSRWKVYVDGKPVTVEAYSIGGSNYLKLRDMAMALSGTSKQFEVGYDSATKIVTIESGKQYTANGTEGATAFFAKSANPGGDPIRKDGKSANVDAYKIDGSNYYGLRAMMQLLDVGLKYDGSTREIWIDTTQRYTG
ncbi:MAG: glycoside hydrolase family 26 protein [Oscillospiraceae bacterium]|jgi:hypothetical protein|nr:glycoside hydrolase family 26 protein [Oscillospiraceae bacterium]